MTQGDLPPGGAPLQRSADQAGALLRRVRPESESPSIGTMVLRLLAIVQPRSSARFRVLSLVRVSP
jgi:hypothetical protein